MDIEMKKTLTAFCCLVLLLTAAQAALANNRIQTSELDAYWAEVARTVGEGDFEGYGATYHSDAVLVNAMSGTSYPIAQALAGWRQGFDDTKAGKVEAGVEFRFTQRLSDGSTAHETGMFHYWVVSEEGQRTDQFVHFEALLVKKDGWKMVMEYQKSVASRAAWEAVG
jgi:ketosteroid isomerase-like protein